MFDITPLIHDFHSVIGAHLRISAAEIFLAL